MHFSPTVEDLFTIIIQISRFLKEFTDFETKKTPEFRHPCVKGKTIQMNEIKDQNETDAKLETGSLFDLFKKKLMKKGLYQEHSERCLQPFKDDGVEVAEKDNNLPAQDEDETKVSYLKDIGLYNELLKMNMVDETAEILSGHELYNVDVPTGKEKFMAYFKDIIWQKKVQMHSLIFR